MMQESERILAREHVPRELLLILVELVDAGVPVDVAERALEMARKPERLREALDACVAAIPDLDAALLAQAEAVVLSSEVAVRNRAFALVRRPEESPPHDA